MIIPAALVIGSSGAALLAGYFTTNATFGTSALTASGTSDVFIASYNNAGAYGWARNYGGAGSTAQATALAGLSGVTSAGTLVGMFDQSISFPGTGNTLTSAGGTDALVARFTY